MMVNKGSDEQSNGKKILEGKKEISEKSTTLSA